MLISYCWLKKFLPQLKASPEEVQERLSVTLAEVASVEKKGDDYILEIENKALTHRSDCFSQYGLAREAAAAFRMKLRKLPPGSEKLNLPPHKVSLGKEIQVVVKEHRLCPRYSAVSLSNLKVAPSPAWLKTAVERLGVRSINNVVDITNFVMLETGQPLHAFDAGNLRMEPASAGRSGGWKVEIRTAQNNEKLVTLDGQVRKLEQGVLLICDANSPQLSDPLTPQLSRPIALAGIMGGKETEISKGTTDIILESANFEPFNNRATSRALGLRTEASLRFEKGLDPNLTENGLKRAIYLLGKHCGGVLSSQIADVYPKKVEPKTIIIDSQMVNKFLGIQLSTEEMQKIFGRLQIRSTLQPPASTLQLTIPTFRRDLNIPQDIYEEIARLYGLNKIAPTLPSRTLSAPQRNHVYDFEQKVKLLFMGLGFDEVYTYSLVPQALTRVRPLLKIQNPISKELEYLRDSLVPSLLEKVQKNAKRFDEIRIFEVGKVTIPKGNKLPSEPKKIAGVIYRKQEAGDRGLKDLYYELKGELEGFFKMLGINQVLFGLPKQKRQKDYPLVAEIKVKNKPAGFIYLTNLQAMAFELDFLSLFKVFTEFHQFKPIFPHPPVKIDLAVVVDKAVLTSQIVDVIKSAGGKLLVDAEPFDLFEDQKTLGRNKKSVALHLTFQSQKESLTLKKIQPYSAKISQSLVKELAAVLR